MAMHRSRVYLQRILLAFLMVLLPGSASFAQGAGSSSLRVVLKGYDPVAYFTEGRPVKGSPEIKHDWDGERFLFSTVANRDRFAADPERYAPQFAGYCTGSMAKGVRNEADPEAWIIADGRLYVFGQVKFADMAKKDPTYLPKTIALAGEQFRAKK
jgi:hypothetical protein